IEPATRRFGPTANRTPRPARRRMDLGLNGKVALDTGAYRGTGAGIARCLAAEGAVTLVHGSEAGQADPAAAASSEAGGRAHAVPGDLRSESGTHRLVDECHGLAGPVDGLVNNDGVPDGGGWFEHDSASWFDVYDRNVVTGVRLVHRLVPAMRDR